MRLSSYHLTFSVAICCQSATADSTGPPQDTWLASRGELPPMPLLFLAAASIMLAGRFGGIAATVTTGLLICLCLLRGRVALAALLAPLEGPLCGCFCPRTEAALGPNECVFHGIRQAAWTA
jgi:hypothetical protein